MLAATNNPVDMAIIGPEGRAALLRESVKSLDIPIDDVVPDRDTIIKNAKTAMMQQMALSEQKPGAAQATDAAGAPAGGQANAF